MAQTISEPSSIERDLDQTRSRLNVHLGELQQRMTPGQVLDDLMRYFRGKEGADFGRSLAQSVRGNPLPAAITGIGLTWLMASNPRAAAPAQPVQPAPPATGTGLHEPLPSPTPSHGQASGPARQGAESGSSFGDRVRAVASSAQQALVANAHDLRDQATGAAGSLGDAVQDAGHSFGGMAQRAGGAIAHAGQAGGQAGARTGGNLLSAVTESPVLLGALGLAAGALLGALLPQLEQEEAALGKLAGQARDAARDFAQDAVDKGGAVAQAVLDKGADSAESHGLTGAKGPGELLDAAMRGDLAKDVKQVVADVVHSGDEAVRKEALGQGKDAPA